MAYTGTTSSPNCGMDGVSVASHMPSAVAENRYSAVAAPNSSQEPLTGTPSPRRTTPHSESRAAARMTSPLAAILPRAISLARTGMTSRCSMVPCSRSRMTAAPTSTMARMVTLVAICITEVNHAESLLGLKCRRLCTRSGSSACALAPGPRSQAIVSCRKICWK